MQVESMSRNRSGLAWARCSSRKRAGSIRGVAVVVVVAFEMDLRLLSNDHAGTVAAYDDMLTEIQDTTVKNTTVARRPAASGPSKLVGGSDGSVKAAR